MCGRLACGLRPQDICTSCCYKDPKDSSFVTPQWRDCFNSGKTYKPSYNICPTEVAPVLLSGNHFGTDSRLVVPMLFGVIPQWSKTGVSRYSTINCRVETILSSKLYGNLLKKNQRCAVICNGFFEWQTQSSIKKPYFIHSEQADEVKVDDPNTWKFEFSPENGFSGYRPLKLAALFEITSDKSMEEVTLSFAVITREASQGTSWLHERVPAVIDTDEQLDAWLNYEVDANHALTSILQKYDKLLCIPVSNLVNQASNKDIACIRENKEPEENAKKRSSAGLFKDWLEKGQKRKCNELEQMGDVSSKF